jgi:hypothetical protein
MFTSLIHSQEQPSKEYVLEVYEYCVSSEGEEDDALLDCVNDVLEVGNYSTFNTIEELKIFIKVEDQ